MKSEDAYTLAGQAADVIKLFMTSGENESPDAMLGLCYLAEDTAADFAGAMGSDDLAVCEKASLRACSLLALMDALDGDQFGGTVFYAAQSLMRAAKAQIDEQTSALAKVLRDGRAGGAA